MSHTGSKLTWLWRTGELMASGWTVCRHWTHFEFVERWRHPRWTFAQGTKDRRNLSLHTDQCPMRCSVKRFHADTCNFHRKSKFRSLCPGIQCSAPLIMWYVRYKMMNGGSTAKRGPKSDHRLKHCIRAKAGQNEAWSACQILLRFGSGSKCKCHMNIWWMWMDDDECLLLMRRMMLGSSSRTTRHEDLNSWRKNSISSGHVRHSHTLWCPVCSMRNVLFLGMHCHEIFVSASIFLCGLLGDGFQTVLFIIFRSWSVCLSRPIGWNCVHQWNHLPGAYIV